MFLCLRIQSIITALTVAGVILDSCSLWGWGGWGKGQRYHALPSAHSTCECNKEQSFLIFMEKVQIL